MTDLISRQAAIDVFEDTTFTKNEIRRRLSELPSAQSEPCGDAVSRQVAIDTLLKWMRPICINNLGEVVESDDMVATRNILKSLPSVQPETCEDAVSRADVEGEIANILRGVFVEYQDIAKKTASKLPPVAPKRKTGKWTNENACEFCGFQPWYERDIHTLSYCPNCGADMRGEQDDSISD